MRKHAFFLCLLGASCVSAPVPRQEPPQPPPAPPAQEPPPKPPEEEPISFIDPEDGAFDISQFLASRIGFMPVPILITEPAVGYGGGLGLMFLHDRLGRRDAEGKSLGTPSITGIAGGYTESDTWFAGALHFGSWDHDRMRYTGVVGGAHANLDYFGTAGGPAGSSGERSLPFQLDGVGIRQELLARLPETDLFLGLRYEYASTRTNFDTGIPAIDDPSLDTEDAALAFVAQFDSRDNILSPNRGVNARLVLSRYDEIFGGDSNYQRIDLEAPFWVPVGESLVASLRTTAAFSDDEAPFYALPYITLRGVPALRYQGTQVLSMEAELRWNFAGRWSLVGFGGLGQAVDSASDFGGEAETITSGGGGFRYLISRVFGLQVGIDVAQGPEETAIYIQVGN
jgi:Omp85 superfamily domain